MEKNSGHLAGNPFRVDHHVDRIVVNRAGVVEVLGDRRGTRRRADVGVVGGRRGVLVPPILFGGLEIRHLGTGVGLTAECLIESERPLGRAIDTVSGSADSEFTHHRLGRPQDDRPLLTDSLECREGAGGRVRGGNADDDPLRGLRGTRGFRRHRCGKRQDQDRPSQQDPGESLCRRGLCHECFGREFLKHRHNGDANRRGPQNRGSAAGVEQTVTGIPPLEY